MSEAAWLSLQFWQQYWDGISGRTFVYVFSFHVANYGKPFPDIWPLVLYRKTYVGNCFWKFNSIHHKSQTAWRGMRIDNILTKLFTLIHFQKYWQVKGYSLWHDCQTQVDNLAIFTAKVSNFVYLPRKAFGAGLKILIL